MTEGVPKVGSETFFFSLWLNLQFAAESCDKCLDVSKLVVLIRMSRNRQA